MNSNAARPRAVAVIHDLPDATELGERLALLELTIAAHDRFSKLTLADASIDDIVGEAAVLAGADVVFSNLVHQVLSVDARVAPVEKVIERWRRSTVAPVGSPGVEVAGLHRVLIAEVAVRGQQRGWLTMLTPAAPTTAHAIVLEHATVALSIALRTQSDVALVTNAHRSLLADIIAGRYSGVEAMHARATALGHPTQGRRLLAVAMRWSRDDAGDVLRQALGDTRLDGIVGAVDARGWGVLLLWQPDIEQRVAAFARRVHQLCATRAADPPTLASGRLVADYADVRGAFGEAFEVATVVESGGVPHRDGEPACFSIRDVQLRGLLGILRDDPRVQSFAARTLNPLLVRDAIDGDKWVSTLSVYLEVRGNKSLAAERLGLSRQTLYERLARIESLLGVHIDDPETSASLFAAIMFVESTGTLAGWETRMPGGCL